MKIERQIMPGAIYRETSPDKMIKNVRGTQTKNAVANERRKQQKQSKQEDSKDQEQLANENSEAETETERSISIIA